MSFLKEIQTRGEIASVSQVMDYLRQLEDQIRYALFNLDGENIQAGAIGSAQLSQGVNGQISTAQSTAEKSGRTARKAQKAVEEMTESMKGMNTRITTQGARIASQGQQLSSLDQSAVRESAGSSSFKLYVGSAAPSGHGVVWIKPGADQGDGTKSCQVLYVE